MYVADTYPQGILEHHDTRENLKNLQAKKIMPGASMDVYFGGPEETRCHW